MGLGRAAPLTVCWLLFFAACTSGPEPSETATPTRLAIEPAPTLSGEPPATREPADGTASPTPTPSPAPTRVPERLTGVAEVDEIIAALYERDVQTLVRALSHTLFECSTADHPRYWQVACSEGESHGTLVKVIPRVGCGPQMLRPAESTVLLRRLADADPQLHSVVIPPESYWPPASHIINFVTDRSDAWSPVVVAVVLRDGAIVGVSNAWCLTSERIELLYPPAYVVPPTPPNEQPDPGRRSGIAVVDRVLDAIQAGSNDDLIGLFQPTKIPCGDGTGERCREGEPEGTIVSVIPYAACSVGYLRVDELLPRFEPGSDSGPFAVTSTEGSYFESFRLPNQKFVLILTTRSSLVLSDTGIVGLQGDCDSHPYDFVRSEPPEPTFLLPPTRTAE